MIRDRFVKVKMGPGQSPEFPMDFLRPGHPDEKEYYTAYVVDECRRVVKVIPSDLAYVCVPTAPFRENEWPALVNAVMMAMTKKDFEFLAQGRKAIYIIEKPELSPPEYGVAFF